MEKMVSWETVRDIANALTNNLEAGLGVDRRQAHLSDFYNNACSRWFELEQGRQGQWRPAYEKNADNGWLAFEEADANLLGWESGRSGSILEARKEEPGKWLLRFSPPKNRPEYRGAYYDLYKDGQFKSY